VYWPARPGARRDELDLSAFAIANQSKGLGVARPRGFEEVADVWEPRSRDLAPALAVDHERRWAWCPASGAMLAAANAAGGASAERVAALLALSP
jgi:hypothetical protein